MTPTPRNFETLLCAEGGARGSGRLLDEFNDAARVEYAERDRRIIGGISVSLIQAFLKMMSLLQCLCWIPNSKMELTRISRRSGVLTKEARKKL